MNNHITLDSATEEPSIQVYRCSQNIFIKIKAMFNSLHCYRDLGDGQFAICLSTYLSETDDKKLQTNQVQYLLSGGEEQLRQLAGIDHAHIKNLKQYFDLLAFKLDDNIK